MVPRELLPPVWLGELQMKDVIEWIGNYLHKAVTGETLSPSECPAPLIRPGIDRKT